MQNTERTMKISNETKVGALTAVAVALLILGFNFLKGKSVFRSGFVLYATYKDTRKLLASNPVFANGLQIGSVLETHAADKSLTEIIVALKLNEDYKLPKNSVATIENNPLGTPSIAIVLGDSPEFLKSGDTIKSSSPGDMLSNLGSKLSPVADKLAGTLTTLDSLLRNVNTLLDPNTKDNLQAVIYNLSRSSQSIVITTAQLQQLLNTQSGALAQSLNNMNAFTSNLAGNNQKVNSIMSHLDSTTHNLARADIQGVVSSLHNSVDSLSFIINKINSTDGTLGALINDKGLYQKLNNTVLSLNTLTDDLRVHPKRYVNISVFGKKDQGNYLEGPLKIDTSALKIPSPENN